MNTRFSLLTLNIVIVLILSCFFNTANAQRRSNRGLNYDGDAAAFSGGGGFGGGSNGDGGTASWGVALQAGFDSPRGDFAASYKGAPLFGISLLKYSKNFTFGVTISRHSNKPAVDSLYVQFDMGEFSSSYNQSIKLTNNNFTGVYASAVYNINIAPGFKCYGGVNFGAMFSSYGMLIKDEYGSYAGTYKDTYGYLAPKVGVEAAIGNGFSIGIEGKYNIFIQGSSDAHSRGGALSTLKSVAGVATLTYSF